MRSAVSRLVLAAAVLSFATGALAQRAPGKAPTGGLEEGLWDVSDKAERAARTSAELNADPALNAYVRAVTCKVAAEYCNDLRVYVMDKATLNAGMAPNGYGEVWAGVLLRAQSEAELAFVIAHEVVHFEQDHLLRTYANFKPDTLRFRDTNALYQFNRDQETEADRLGLRRMAKHGYSPSAAAAFWRAAEAEGRVSIKLDENIRRKTHPADADRVAVLDAEAKALPAGGVEGRERHRAAIRPHLSAWLKLELKRADYGSMTHLLDRLAASGEDLGMIGFYRGESRRLHGPSDAEATEKAYAEAVKHKDAPAAAWRELGEMRRKRGDKAGARVAFETYLQRAPEAEDAWIVRDALKSLG